ncbi:MAG: hypothetical protein GY835_26315 [bacterium]|nr:hypothetical protein [bacterium]
MTSRKFLVAALILVGFLLGCLAGFRLGRMRDIPLCKHHTQWSIGIYSGSTPMEMTSIGDDRNPVLTAEQIDDMPAATVADPFLFPHDDKWLMFFEVISSETFIGCIGLAESSDGLDWSYRQVVLEEPFHLSYPQVFEWEGECYMLPESHKAFSLRLYKAKDFPLEWEFHTELMTGIFVDSTILRYRDRWWLFASTNPHGDTTLRLYFADNLEGPWREHAASPLIDGDGQAARPAGRLIEWDGRLFRLAQDSFPLYGRGVNAFEILELDPERYEERPYRNGVIYAGDGDWNGAGMHQLDAHPLPDGSWIAAVDGLRTWWSFEL